MHFHTAAQCCNEIEELIRIAEPPSRDSLLRLMVVEKRLRVGFCDERARSLLRTLIDAIERYWTVGMFPAVAGEGALLQARALAALEALRDSLSLNRDTDSANDSLMAA